jgi:hypothetical protein
MPGMMTTARGKRSKPERVSLRTSVIGKPIPEHELEAIRRWVYEGKR